MPVFAIKSTYDIHKPQREYLPSYFDVIQPDRLVMAPARYDAMGRFQTGVQGNFDSIAHAARTCISGVLASNSFQFSGCAVTFDACRFRDQAFSALLGFYDRTPSSATKTNGRFGIIKRSHVKTPGNFDIWFRMQATAQNGHFDALSGVMAQVSGLFDAIPDKTRSGVCGCFDAIARTTSALSFSFQAFVQPGWRIRLRNTETDEVFDLGFIDADSSEKSLENVAVPDGDYEIQVLTSSLFWKDSVDRFARTISVRAGEEPTIGLPPVLGLYSKVENGVTTVFWSTHAGDYEGASFGLWFSQLPPVDTNRLPDQTVQFTSGQTDYFYRLTQSVPLWLVIMPVKGSMFGQAAEIFLNWSDLKPRRPHDQTARNVYIDENLPVIGE